jgi:protein TonB
VHLLAEDASRIDIMRLFLSCLLSLGLHCILLLLLYSPWSTRMPLPKTYLPATLRPSPGLAVTSADTIAAQPVAEPSSANDRERTETSSPDKSPPPRRAPRTLSGSALRHAQAALSKHLFYPPEAIEQGLEGDVVLLLALDENGRILTAEIATSSGHALLDQAALDAARHIGALPGNPQQTLLPVSFRLQ